MLFPTFLQILLILGDLVIHIRLMLTQTRKGGCQSVYLLLLLFAYDTPVRDFLQVSMSAISLSKGKKKKRYQRDIMNKAFISVALG